VCRVMCRGSSEALLLLELSCSCSAQLPHEYEPSSPSQGDHSPHRMCEAEGCEERPAARGVRTQFLLVRPVRFIPGCCKFGKLPKFFFLLVI